MASMGVQYQPDYVQCQPLTMCNTGENGIVSYVDSCNEIIHHMIIGVFMHRIALLLEKVVRQ